LELVYDGAIMVFRPESNIATQCMKLESLLKEVVFPTLNKKEREKNQEIKFE
jgi:hypothetical protein